MSSTRHKLVIKKVSTTGIYGIQTLNGISQPYIDGNGNLDMSSNFLKVKNIEAGIQEFTTNGELGVINAYSDSTNTNVSCINFMHDPPNGSDRRYCSFQSKVGGHVIGSITGNGGQVSFNTTSDSRLKEVLNSTGEYMYDSISQAKFNSWLDSVNALNPLIYRYDNNIVDQANVSFTHKLQDGMTENTVHYQGFLAHEIQSVYPPAVTGTSGETINVNDVQKPVYQQVDMTKLIPMMVGAIKELSTTVVQLNTTLSDLSDFSILNPTWNNWTIIKINDNIRVFSTTDTDKGLTTYTQTRFELKQVAWGVNQLHTQRFTSVEQKRDYLAYQLSQMYFSWAPVINMRFIYDFNEVWNSQDFKTEYSYQYYIKNESNEYIDLSVNNITDVSGTFALIYDLDSTDTYNNYLVYTTLSWEGFTWNTVKAGETATVYYSTFLNETNPLATFYDNIQPNLTSVYWGASQYNTLLTMSERITLLQAQLNEMLFSPVQYYQFIYDFSMNAGTYTYSYYRIVPSSEQPWIGIIEDTSYNGTDPSGTIGVIYDTSL